MKIGKKKIELSATSAMHYYKLFVRSGLLLVALLLYVFGRIDNNDVLFGSLERYPQLVAVITVFYAVEMVLRFTPSKIESMGCQKQFDVNYKPVKHFTVTGESRAELIKGSIGRVLLALAAWVALNGIFFFLYYKKIIDSGVMLLISLFYGVCDMICILFFCPFQEWILKNKCCGSCLIYNWDYAMMFTPLIVVRNLFADILIILSLLLFLYWEWNYFKYPERFFEVSNQSLECVSCTEKLCSHKKSLQRFLVEFRRAAAQTANQAASQMSKAANQATKAASKAANQATRAASEAAKKGKKLIERK